MPQHPPWEHDKTLGLWSSTLPPFAKDAKDGAPFVYGGVGKVHGSFVGSPWLCQGLRCLRMTGLGKRRRLDNSFEGWPWFVAFLFSNFHLEQSRKTPRPRRLLLLPTGVPTTHSFGQSSCREFPSASCRYRQTRGPSTPQDRPRADDLSALGMTEYRETEYRETDADAHPSFLVVSAVCRDPSLGPWLCQGLRCLRMTACGRSRKG